MSQTAARMDETELASRSASDLEQFPFDSELWKDQPLGVILREFRHAYGLNLHQVSDATKVRTVYLDYLEKGEHDSLPGQVYGLGFVKSYASYLGLPVDEMTARFRAEVAEQPAPDNPKAAVISSPYARDNERPPLGTILGAVIAALIVLYLLWFLISRLSFDVGEGPSISERLSKFIFGREHENSQIDSAIDPGLENAPSAGPIIVATDGTITVAPSPAATLNRPATTPVDPNFTPPPDTLADANARVFPNSKVPVPGKKPDLSAQALQVTQVPAPRNLRVGNSATPDPDTPLIAPRAVNVGQPGAFGTATGFASAPTQVAPPTLANVEAINLGVEQPAPQTEAEVETEAEAQPTPQETEPTAAPATPRPQTAPQRQAQQQVQPQPADDPAKIRIVVKAKARTWAQVRNLQGQVITYKMLEPGGELEVPNLKDIRLLTGSLDSLELQVDGRTVKTPASINPGTDTIVLNPEALLR